MGFLHLLIAALAASAVLAADPACTCVNVEQKIDPISNPMIFFQQPTTDGKTNGPPCSANCNYIAHAFDEDVDGLSLQILANNLGTGKITIHDGPRDHVIVKTTTQADIDWKSVGGNLTFEFTEDSSNVGTFMLVLQKSARDPTPSVIPSTVAPVTPAYTGGLKRNPLLVADDIMLVIDISSDRLEDLKKFAIDIVQNLTVTNEKDCGVGSRIALHGVSGYPSFNPQYIPDWEYTTESALGNINAMSKIGDDPFHIDQVQSMVDAGFGDDNCPNRGRFFILLTTSMPAEYNEVENQNTQIEFIKHGVHPILVSPLKDKQRNYYDFYKKDQYNKWSYVDLDHSTSEFFNNYLVDTSSDVTCQPLAEDLTVTLTSDTVGDANSLPVSIPPYYSGKKEGGDEEDWNTVKHYCNFQSTTVSIVQTNDAKKLTNKKDVCLTVFYDLEPDQDFVSIYGGDYAKGDQKLVVKLTGRDVSGTTFRLGNTVGSIVFSSDEKNVYDGFYTKIYACGADAD